MFQMLTHDAMTNTVDLGLGLAPMTGDMGSKTGIKHFFSTFIGTDAAAVFL